MTVPNDFQNLCGPYLLMITPQKQESTHVNVMLDKYTFLSAIYKYQQRF